MCTRVPSTSRTPRCTVPPRAPLNAMEGRGNDREGSPNAFLSEAQLPTANSTWICHNFTDNKIIYSTNKKSKATKAFKFFFKSLLNEFTDLHNIKSSSRPFPTLNTYTAVNALSITVQCTGVPVYKAYLCNCVSLQTPQIAALNHVLNRKEKLNWKEVSNL